MKAKGIFLSWIVVKDIKKAIQFYTEVVGLQLNEHHPEYNWAELSGEGGARLGIAAECPQMAEKAGINAVMTISVDDIEKAKAHFKQKGAKLVGETIEVPGIVKMQNFEDADGNQMQIVQTLNQ